MKEKYIGVKIIKAEPMDCQKDSHNSKVGDPGYDVEYENGYKSWSPAEVFEKAYIKTNGITFGLAIEAAKLGHKVSRTGWNGKGMFVVYQKGYPKGISCNKQTAEAWALAEGDLFKVEPYLQIRMVNGSHAMWAPSINDVLSEDWSIVNE